MKKKEIAIIVLTAVIGILVGYLIGIGISSREIETSNINNVSETPVQMKKISMMEVTRSVFYAPQYVALNKGFFKEEGLEIDLTTGSGADSVMTAVLAHQVDIGFAGPEASIYVYNEGSTNYPKVFAQLTKRDGSFLVSRTKQDDFKWENVKNSIIIPGRVGGVPNMTLQYVLRKHGIDPEKDVKLDTSISYDLMAGAFSAGNADYVALFEPIASATEKANAGYIVSSIGAETEEVTYTTYFAESDYIEKNGEVISKFKNAINKGLEWTYTHSAEEIAESITDYFPDTDKELLITVIQNYKDIDSWNKTTKVSEKGFELLQTIMEQAGQLEKRVNYSDVVIQ